MTGITLNSMNQRVDLTGTEARLAIPLSKPMGIDVLAAVSDGPFAGLRRSPAAGRMRLFLEPRGLGRIEPKVTRNRTVSAISLEVAGAPASVWIGIPFTAVFVLGCLTLA